MLLLPGRRLRCGLAPLIEHTGARPPAKHGGSWGFFLGDAQVNVRGQEPGVAVLFHQAVDFNLGCFKTALCGMWYISLDVHLGGVVNVDLSER